MVVIGVADFAFWSFQKSKTGDFSAFYMVFLIFILSPIHILTNWLPVKIELNIIITLISH
jgi:hypothetical protein